MGSSLNGRSVILLHTIVHSSFALFSKFRYVSILCSCCTIFMLHILRVAFFSYFAFSIMHLSDLARCTFFGCSFRCSFFSFCTFFMLHVFRIALFSCFAISFTFHVFFVLLFFHFCTFSVLHSFNISLFLLLFMFSLSYTCFSYTLTLCTLTTLVSVTHLLCAHFLSMVHFPDVSLFSCCTFFHIAFVSCWTLFMLVFFRVTLFSCSFSVLHSFHVALSSCCAVISELFKKRLFVEKFGAIAFLMCCIEKVP